MGFSSETVSFPLTSELGEPGRAGAPFLLHMVLGNSLSYLPCSTCVAGHWASSVLFGQ